MDRRQRKTRSAIFEAFLHLLSQKNVNQITVGEIIALADVGRATFYSHFPSKDFLLKELCEELFCHIFDEADKTRQPHQHIFQCDAPESVFLHLLQHLKRNDNHILELLTGRNNELFSDYFKKGLFALIENQLPQLMQGKPNHVPTDFWLNHLTGTFTETVRWWVSHGLSRSPEEVHGYFLAVIGADK